MKQEPKSARYRLAFIDLDDTLLGPDKRISPANLRALGQLRSAGVEIAIASGRHHQNITGLSQLGPAGWVLSSHGSVVRHEQTGEVLAEAYLDGAMALELGARAPELGLRAIVYHRDGAFLERTSVFTEQYAREAGWTPQAVRFSELDPLGFQKVIWAGHPEHIEELAPAAQEEFSERANVLVTNPELLEFFPRRVNKAVGAQALVDRLQVPVEETLAFGDGSNDVELLRWAGLSVAMDHGRQMAREAARFVTPPGPPENAFSRAVELALDFQS